MKNRSLPAILIALLMGTAVSAQSLSGRILFSLQNASYDADSICTLQPDGTGFLYITNGSFPRLSKDGQYMAYLYGVNGSRNTNDIYFRNAAGAQYEFYNNGSQQHIYNYDFTPTTNRLVFDWEGTFYDQLAAQAGGGNSNLGSGAGDFNDMLPRINPVDSTIAFCNDTHGIYLLPISGTVTSSIIPNTGAGDVCPYWSADGQWIYFMKQYVTGTFKMRHIYRIKPNGTGLTQITNLPATDTLGKTLVITNNGKWGVVPARLGGIIGLYKFRMDNAVLQTKGYLIKAFPHIKSVENIWVGNADAVTDPTAINEASKKTGKIYPNPVKDYIHIELDHAGYYEYTFYNTIGQISKHAAISQSQNISVIDLAAGTYFLELREPATQSLHILSFIKE